MKIINNWAFQWKINFSPDPTKETQEVIFSCKAKEIYHPRLVFTIISNKHGIYELPHELSNDLRPRKLENIKKISKTS